MRRVGQSRYSRVSARVSGCDRGGSTYLVRRKGVGSDERRGPRHNHRKHVVDHRREVLPHQLRLGRHHREEQGESSTKTTECFSNVLADERLLGDLSLEEDTLGLGE